MNILLVGNGFDILHGLLTKYVNFLDFCKIVNELSSFTTEPDDINWYSLEETYVKDKIIEEYRKIDENGRIPPKNVFSKISNYIENNAWLEYFNSISNKANDGWIDLESEIAKVISFFEKESITNDTNIENFLNKPFIEDNNIKQLCQSIALKSKTSIETEENLGLINVLENDLNDFCFAFQVYLVYFIENKDLIEKNFIKELKINKVISFNYTKTHEKLYSKTNNKIEYNYIHGSVVDLGSIESFIENSTQDNNVDQLTTCNIVLGIDETLSKNLSNKNLEFVKFKKYYQRIRKDVDRDYIKWLEEIAEQHNNYVNHKKDYKNIKRAIRYFRKNKKIKLKKYRKYYHNLYIIGHSLDITDGDILRTLIINDNVRTTIYYHNNKSYNEKIENLIKIIGKKELIKRTGGKNQTIFFIKQPE